MCPLARATHATPLRSMSIPRGEKPCTDAFGLLNGGSKISVSVVCGGFDPGVMRSNAPGKPSDDAQMDPSAAGATAYRPFVMRLSFVGSTGWLGSTYASRLPLPFVSRISALQPCAFSSSPVSSNSFVLSQPTTWPPPLVQSVLFASSANIRWCVPKHVLMCVSFFVFGSYIASWRPERGSGNNCAEG